MVWVWALLASLRCGQQGPNPNQGVASVRASVSARARASASVVGFLCYFLQTRQPVLVVRVQPTTSEKIRTLVDGLADSLEDGAKLGDVIRLHARGFHLREGVFELRDLFGPLVS